MSSNPFYRCTRAPRLLLLTAVLAVIAPVGNVHAVQVSGPGDSPHADAAPQVDDCHSISELTAKEACFAAQSDELVAQCEAIRVNACRPYGEMHRAERRLSELGVQLLAINRKRFDEYSESDPAYLDDLGALASASGQAWRAWRDAACSLEPFADGMSRREAADLTEACRAEWTEKRVSEIASRIQELEQARE